MNRSIREILELDRWPDLLVGPNGYAAKRRPDIAPFAYEILVNKPLEGLPLKKIYDFAGAADKRLTKNLFECCNGIRIGATKFAVFGVVDKINRTLDDRAYHPPLDINIPNIYGRPASWPEDYLIVGSSTEGYDDVDIREMTHAITPAGSIIVACEGDYLSVNRSYFEVDEWLSKEVDRALANCSRY